MSHVVRLATVHPVLAHFTIGGLPLMVIAYVLAVRRRAAQWTLVGDAALAVTALATLGTGDFLDAMRGVRAAWGSIEGRLASMLVQSPRDADFARIAVDAARLEQLATAMGNGNGGAAERRELIAMMTQTLAGDGSDIEEAARKHDLQALARAVGEASAHCADCHQQVRWC